MYEPTPPQRTDTLLECSLAGATWMADDLSDDSIPIGRIFEESTPCESGECSEPDCLFSYGASTEAQRQELGEAITEDGFDGDMIKDGPIFEIWKSGSLIGCLLSKCHEISDHNDGIGAVISLDIVFIREEHRGKRLSTFLQYIVADRALDAILASQEVCVKKGYKSILLTLCADYFSEAGEAFAEGLPGLIGDAYEEMNDNPDIELTVALDAGW